MLINLIALGEGYTQSYTDSIPYTLTSYPPQYQFEHKVTKRRGKIYKEMPVTLGMDCIPLAVSERLHEDAARKPYLDSMVQAREVTIIRLETKITRLSSQYENLLANEEKENNVLATAFQNQGQELDNYKKMYKQQKRKTRWSNIKLYTVLAGLGILTYRELKE